MYIYEVSSDGNSYNILAHGDAPYDHQHNDYKIHCRTWPKDTQRILQRTLEAFGKTFEDTLYFRTFPYTDDKALLKKLADKETFKDRIKIVMPHWENILGNDDGDELVRFVHNNIDKVYDDEEQIIHRYQLV